MQSGTEDRLIRELEALPELAPPPEAEPRVLAAMRVAAMRVAADARGTRYRGPIAAFAIAAGAAAAALLLWQPWRLASDDVPAVADVTPNGTGATGDDLAPEPSAGTSAAADNYFVLVEQSAELERALFALPAQRVVMRASTAGTIATLEDSIARIDAELTLANAAGAENEYRTALWRERVDVMSALVQVRYANSQAFTY